MGNEQRVLTQEFKLEAVHVAQSSGHQTKVEEENRRLKRENELLKQERDSFKKAVGIFSRGQL
jgi:hypothetical protein